MLTVHCTRSGRFYHWEVWSKSNLGDFLVGQSNGASTTRAAAEHQARTWLLEQALPMVMEDSKGGK